MLGNRLAPDPKIDLRRTEGEAQFHVPEDPYHWTTDNRPLVHLLRNDLELEKAIRELWKHVFGLDPIWLCSYCSSATIGQVSCIHCGAPRPMGVET